MEPPLTEDLTPGVIALLGLAALAAGWIDAVVGGGGLIQLPALLIGIPSATPAQLLATNKVSSIFGTATSSVTYVRRVGADLRTALPMAAVAYVGAIGGAVIGLHIPKSAFYPIILVLLVVVGAYTILRPDLGRESIKRFHGHKHVALAMLTGLVIGVYDGALGPGTGSFLVFALVGLLGYTFLEASVKAKIANFATNLGALTVFAPGGHVLWQVGLVMAVGNIAGGYIGARTAVARGSGFVRAVFVMIVSAFIIRIGGSLLGFWT
ncbi:MAG TPA: TSUP family transporter [Intrasporangium sp.]|nr:TSUP family transporter [Intrasporangium sp.]